MSKQFTFGNIDEDGTDGFDLADFLEQFEAAIYSSHEGPAAPEYKIQGITWRDTTTNPHLIKMYDGTSWITIGSLDTTAHTYTPYFNGAVIRALANYGIGLGLMDDTTNGIKIKLDGNTLDLGAGGLKVKDKGIALTQMADGVIGSLLTYITDGVISALVAGAEGTQLTAHGVGNALTWEAPAAGMITLGDYDLAGLALQDHSIDTDLYSAVEIEFANVRSTTTSASNYLGLRLGSSGVINTGTVYASQAEASSGGNIDNLTETSFIPLAGTVPLLITANRGMFGKIYLPLLDDEDAYKYLETSVMQPAATTFNPSAYNRLRATYKSALPIDIIRLFRTNVAGGDFLSGRMVIRGKRK